jgi:hypothetical protein
MASFTDFTDILPTPDDKIGIAGQADASGRAGPGFASLRLTSSETILRKKLNSGVRDSQKASFHKWIVDINYNPLPCGVFHALLAFLSIKRTLQEPFYISLPQYTNQSIADKGVYSSGVEGRNTIVIDGTGVVAGAMFTEFNVNDKAYLVTRVETETDYFSPEGSPGAGRERLHVSPAFKSTILNSAVLDFTNPLMKVKVVQNTIQYSVTLTGLFNLSLQVEEVLS